MSKHIRAVQQPAVSRGLFHLAETQQIGTRVKEYKGTAFMKSLLGISLSILGSAFLLAGVAVLIYNPRAFFTGVYAGIFGFCLLSFGVLQLRVALRARGARIYLGTDGVMRVKGKQTEVMRWDHIVAVQKVFTQLQNNFFLSAYLLLQRDGSALALEKSYKDFKGLGKTIEEEVTRRLLPEAIRAYHAGSPVNFGSILVDAQGIHVQKQKEQKTLAWNEFKMIKEHDGRLMIKKQGALTTWETLFLPQVPNLCVLLALIEHIVDGYKPPL